MHICSGYFTQVSEPWLVGLLLFLLFPHFHYSPTLKKWGYTGFAMSFRHSMIP